MSRTLEWTGQWCRDVPARCCPGQLARKIPRDVHEDARDMTRRVQNLKTLALRALGPPAALHSASFA